MGLTFGHAQSTAYLLKLVDIAPNLMRVLPFPIGRASAEGSEGGHYDRQTGFYRYLLCNYIEDNSEFIDYLFIVKE